MANQDHLDILMQGVDAWNSWRSDNPNVHPELSGANLYGKNLGGINLFLADLTCGDLRGAYLGGANLSSANLTQAKLWGTYLVRANLQGTVLCNAELRNAKLEEANLCGANFEAAELFKANLTGAYIGVILLGGLPYRVVKTSFKNADLTGCRIYGISSWDVILDGTTQNDLVITRRDQPTITVDNLEIAQFIYLLLNNEKIRHVIETITSKVVLILGRFSKHRKEVLNAIRTELRNRDYVPVLFDFNKPESRNITETVSFLAHMARFIIADITDAKSIPQELQRIVPDLPSVPVKPLLLSSEIGYGMFEHFKSYPWVLEVHRYDNQQKLIESLSEKIIAPSEAKAEQLRR